MKKTRFIVVLLGMLIPMTSFAGVPNADFMNLGTNLVENIQTVYSKIENGLQVTTLQSTMSKMGSAKSSVSGLFNKLKDVNDRPLLSAQTDEIKKQKLEQIFLSRSEKYLQYADIVLNVSGILESRNLLDEQIEKQLGALYIEFLNSFEKKVYK